MVVSIVKRLTKMRITSPLMDFPLSSSAQIASSSAQIASFRGALPPAPGSLVLRARVTRLTLEVSDDR